MHHLQRQYKALLVTLLGMAIVIHFASVRFVLAPGSIDPSSPLAFFLAQTAIYTSIVVFPLFVFEKWAWKWCNRHLDLSGPWEYRLTYTPATNAQSLRDFVASLPLEGSVEIVQSPFFIRMESGAESFTDDDGVDHLISWYSTSADFASDTRLVISFELRAGNRLFRGIEEIAIHRTNGRPTNLHSQFVMHDAEHKPIAYGELYYHRTRQEIIG